MLMVSMFQTLFYLGGLHIFYGDMWRMNLERHMVVPTKHTIRQNNSTRTLEGKIDLHALQGRTVVLARSILKYYYNITILIVYFNDA